MWFGSHPQVTYFLEPCSLVYLEGIRRDKTGKSCAAAAEKLSRCEFSHVALHRNHKDFIPDSAPGFKGWGHQNGPKDVQMCSSREAVVVKELRLGMAFAKGEASFPKAIVLFRDPRAIVNSRSKGWPARRTIPDDCSANPLGWDGERGFPYQQSLKSLCAEHLALREKVENDKSGNLVKVEYREVLDDAESLLRKLMAFTEIELVPEVLEFVKKNTNGTCDFPNEQFSVCRSKIPKKDDKWKKELGKEHLEEIQNTPECVKVIETYYKEDDEYNQTDEL